jgi:hypothetical protein
MSEWEEDNEDTIWEEEEYHCVKCGAVLFMRLQSNGSIGLDEGHDRCEECFDVYCKDCGNWFTYGDRYKKICETCFNKEILEEFAEWHEIFEDEYCHRHESGCDGCPFFFKTGCMMMLFDALVDTAFHTKELKKEELNRLQQKNRQAEKEWEKHLKEAIERSKTQG